MTVKEALESLKYEIFEEGHCSYIEEEMIIAIQSLEKQIPKKPIYSDYDDNGFGEILPEKATCPNCGEGFAYGEWNEEETHHCVCGQAIDWNV